VGIWVESQEIGLGTSERDEAQRAAWRGLREVESNGEKLVFVDENGCNLAVTPLYVSGHAAYC
jgi:hypothetical protein